jgi:hypothetical protein
MEKIEFKIKLKKASLNKKSFAQIFGLKYQSVNSWGNNGRTIPYWVDSWLDLYIENQKHKELQRVIKNSGICNSLES